MPFFEKEPRPACWGRGIETRCDQLGRQRAIRRFIGKRLLTADAFGHHLSPGLAWRIGTYEDREKLHMIR